MHGSESRGQEEAGLCNEPVSYLQVAPGAVRHRQYIVYRNIKIYIVI